jgi:hypothetical protein
MHDIILTNIYYDKVHGNMKIINLHGARLNPKLVLNTLRFMSRSTSIYTY